MINPLSIDQRLRALEEGRFPGTFLAGLRRVVLNVTTGMQKGQYAGFGNPQVDTYNYPDNCTATFPWTFDFVIPKNFQRWTSVHFSFKLRAFRRYVSAINNNSVTSGGTRHFHVFGSGSTGALSQTAGFDSSGNFTTGVVGNSACTTDEIITANPGVGIPPGPYTPGTHTHSVTPNTTLSTGIFEDTTPTSVSLKIDGTDYTSALGGPWTVDTVELDITAKMPTSTGAFHTIQLTPNQNGRITGELRFSYFVDGSVTA